MAIIEVKVPDVGTDKAVDVIEVSVKPGDTVAAEQTLIVLESDKATVEVPSPVAGVVQSVVLKVGDKVTEGAVILVVETGAVAGADSLRRAEARPTGGGETTDASRRAEARPATIDIPADGNTQGVARVITLVVPDIGTDKAVDVIEVSVKPGDTVAVEQTLIVLESDKATMEVPAEAAGTIVDVLVKRGDKVKQGASIAIVSTTGDSATAAGTRAAPVVAAAAAEALVPARRAIDETEPHDLTRLPPAVSGSGSPAVQSVAHVHAGPAVRRLARELGVDLATVKGTGARDRITKDDVHAHVKALLSARPAAAAGGGTGLPELPRIDFAKWGPVEELALGKLRRVAAQNLHRAWLTIPHVTQHDEADITEAEAFRVSENARLKDEGVKLTMLAFLVKASVAALKQYPKFNSSLDVGGEKLVVKHYWHIGIAVDTPEGLVVPVIRDADRKGIVEIAREMAVVSKKAREKKLTPADMSGATFSISSLGGIGGTGFTPIVNWPEVAILGVSKSQMKPVWDGKSFAPRLMLPLSLSYDHRVIDGADAARFTAALASSFADLRRLLL